MDFVLIKDKTKAKHVQRNADVGCKLTRSTQSFANKNMMSNFIKSLNNALGYEVPQRKLS